MRRRNDDLFLQRFFHRQPELRRLLSLLDLLLRQMNETILYEIYDQKTAITDVREYHSPEHSSFEQE